MSCGRLAQPTCLQAVNSKQHTHLSEKGCGLGQTLCDPSIHPVGLAGTTLCCAANFGLLPSVRKRPSGRRMSKSAPALCAALGYAPPAGDGTAQQSPRYPRLAPPPPLGAVRLPPAEDASREACSLPNLHYQAPLNDFADTSFVRCGWDPKRVRIGSRCHEQSKSESMDKDSIQATSRG